MIHSTTYLPAKIGSSQLCSKLFGTPFHGSGGSLGSRAISVDDLQSSAALLGTRAIGAVIDHVSGLARPTSQYRLQTRKARPPVAGTSVLQLRELLELGMVGQATP